MTRPPRGEPDLPPGPARDLVDLFRRLRHAHTVSHGQVVIRTGLSRSHVSEVLSGWKAPSPEAAAKIVKALGGTPNEAAQAHDWAEKLAELNRHYRQRSARSGGLRAAGRAAAADVDASADTRDSGGAGAAHVADVDASAGTWAPSRAAAPDTASAGSALEVLGRVGGVRGAGRADVAVRLLGPVRVESGGELVQLGGPTARALFAVLLLQGDPGATTEELISWVWGGPGAVTRASVYHYVAGLRSALANTLGQASLEAGHGRYRLHVDDQLVDWRQFRRLVADARLARDRRDPDGAAGLLRGALDLWGGAPLADTSERLDPFRGDMLRQRRTAVEGLAGLEATRGRPQQVVELLSEHLVAEPGRELAAALLIDALAALGRRDEVGEVFRRTRTHLVRVSGLEPGERLQEAFRRALQGTTPVDPAVSVVRSPRPASGLPRPDRLFTGRTRELAALSDALTGPDAPALCAVSGMPGAGKTAFAVRAARMLADAYPDGTLFIDLHGYTEGHAPLTATEALDRLLRRLGLAGDAIPADVDERAALFAELLAERRMLVVLDNARSVGQIRPLLPGAPDGAVIVTSRVRLTALDDAYPIVLDLLAPDEAVELFRVVAGDDRAPEDDAVVRRIVERCDRLPLAIRIAASKHRVGRQSLAELAGQMSDAYAALSELDDHERSVAASFQVSLTDLPESLARTFALLAAHPGVDVDPYAAAAAIDTSPVRAARDLEGLVERNLLVAYGHDRYRSHDLVGAFAARHAETTLPPETRTAALRRVVDYYLRAAERSDGFVTPHRYRMTLDADPTAELPPITTYEAAFAWLDAEHPNLVAAVLAAERVGFDGPCWQLACTLRGYFFLTKSWPSWLATHESALRAARRAGDVRAEATVVNNLGLAYLEQNEHDLAARHYEQARALFASVDDVPGEQTARANLAWHLFARHEYGPFLSQIAPILSYYRESGSERNAAITLRGIGLAKAELGRVSEAVVDLTEALAVFRRLDLRLDIAMSWNALGETHQRAGDAERATEALTAGLAASEECGSVFEQARAHHRLGQLATDPATRRAHRERALDGYRRLRAPQADEVAAELAD